MTLISETIPSIELERGLQAPESLDGHLVIGSPEYKAQLSGVDIVRAAEYQDFYAEGWRPLWSEAEFVSPNDYLEAVEEFGFDRVAFGDYYNPASEALEANAPARTLFVRTDGYAGRVRRGNKHKDLEPANNPSEANRRYYDWANHLRQERGLANLTDEFVQKIAQKRFGVTKPELPKDLQDALLHMPYRKSE